jgi:hypothetical protein
MVDTNPRVARARRLIALTDEHIRQSAVLLAEARQLLALSQLASLEHRYAGVATSSDASAPTRRSSRREEVSATTSRTR